MDQLGKSQALGEAPGACIVSKAVPGWSDSPRQAFSYELSRYQNRQTLLSKGFVSGNVDFREAVADSSGITDTDDIVVLNDTKPQPVFRDILRGRPKSRVDLDAELFCFGNQFSIKSSHLEAARASDRLT